MIKYLIFACVLIGCTKDEKCQNYYLLTESNEKEARYKCQGLANSYPQFNIIDKKPIGCLTSAELTQAKKATTIITKQMCSGVSFTIKQSIVK